MIRLFDILFSFIGLVLLSPLLLIVVVIIIFDTGSPFFLQERVGAGKKSFKLLKFRSMHLDTQSTATHLVQVSAITKSGFFLRKTKLDELPQLINVLIGDMSLVGPRPNLFNQDELICEREKLGVYNVRPGITGLAQINKIDMSTPKLLAETDKEMISQQSIFTYFKYIFLTIIGNGMGDRIKT
jgi:lipopolysaccharide/colanic/teichoic acid biosynthesis glycosyltransferase